MKFEDHLIALKDKPTYVVLGVQGSGTNLVSRILARVFGVSIVRDRSLILGTAASLVGKTSAADYDRAWNKIYDCLFPGPIRKRLLSRQWYHQASEYRGIENHRQAVELKTPAEFADFFYSYHAFVAGRVDRGFKSDDCWQHLGAMPDVIPNRKTVLVVRDPRDNANSIMFKDFGPRTAFAASRFVNRQLDLYLAETDSRPSDSLVVKYETLLSRPTDFVADFAELSGIEVPPDAEQKLDELDIRVTNFDKWKKWNHRDIAVSESILHDKIERLGYDLQNHQVMPITPSIAATQQVIDVMKRIPQRIKSTWDHKILAR